MSYVITTANNPFHKDEEHPEQQGYDYVTADELIKRTVDTGMGRFYFNGQGNAVYESRFHREL